MGNKLGRRRQVVDEQYTRPQGLYHLKEVDPKKLKKLILDSKLAPCYPGAEEGVPDLEECPICFLYYPSLNRSRCCTKGICTECLLQMKPPHSTRPTQCPFCKTSNYAVEYRGFRTKEEKGMEQIEEQKVIEAKIRMRKQEQDEEERRMQRRQEMGSSSRIMTPDEAEYRDMSSSSDNAVPSFSFPAQSDEIIPSPDSRPMSGNGYPAHARQSREDEFDLEELMVMEAIWRSIQEQETSRNPVCGDTTASEPSVLEDRQVSMVGASSESSPSIGLPCAAAALSKHQHMDDENSIANVSGHVPSYLLPQDSGPSYPDEGMAESYQPESWIEVSPESGRALPMEGGEWAVDHGSEVAEAGTSYASSDTAVDAGATSALNEGVGDVFQPPMAGILPDSFEEQMMLAMAISQVEARARTSYQGLAWYL